MIRLHLFLAFSLLVFLPNVKGQTLEEFVEDLVTSEFIPATQSVGFGLSIWSGQDGNLYRNGFGFRDIESNASATEKSIFCIGSITKSFTSSIIVKFLSENFSQYGELALEMPIKDLASSVNVTLSDRYRSESISFRDLTSHRSCLNSHLNGVVFGQIKDFDEYIYRTRYESEICPFRAYYVYNNAMYALAGDLIAKLAGNSYENLMRQFLDELGMRDSQLIRADEDYGTLENMMQGYYINGAGSLLKANPDILRQVAHVSPAGALLSTAEDMQKYVHFHLSGGQSVGGQQVVSNEAMKWITRPAILLSGGGAYGMGFNIGFVAGADPNLSHGGYWPPFNSFLSIVPSLNVGIFTSSGGPGQSNTGQLEVHNRIYQFIAAQSGKNDDDLDAIPCIQSQNENVGPIQFLVKSAPTPSIKNGQIRALCSQDDVLGSFGSAINGEIEIYTDVETLELKIKYGFWGDGVLTQIETEECKFDIEWTTDIALFFYTGRDGVMAESSLELLRSEVTGTWDEGPFNAAGEVATVHRNLNIGTLPQLPYDPESCVAENYYG